MKGSTKLPPLLPVGEIHDRLQRVFPEGTPNRTYCTREMAAKTVFTMLYVGAVAEADRWLRPDQVTRMTDRQAQRTSRAQRESWRTATLRPGRGPITGRWYAVNTREPIRDETLREGLIRVGAVVERAGLPTTSPSPRYGLAAAFVRLLDPALTGGSLQRAIERWQAAHLAAGALARIAIMRKGAVASDEGVVVAFPSGETRRMAPGPSSLITKAVVEVFAPRFLGKPAVVLLSESRTKVVARDDELAAAVGLEIHPDRNLPDIVLADLEPADPLIVFVEVVATDGPVSEGRRAALLQTAEGAGFEARRVGFVTAYRDRSDAVFKRTVDALAWNSFAWFASEPRCLVSLRGPTEPSRHLSELLRDG